VGGVGTAVSIDLSTRKASDVRVPVPVEMQNDRGPIRVEGYPPSY